MNISKLPNWKISNLILVVIAASTLIISITSGLYIYKSDYSYYRKNMIESNERSAALLETAITESVISQDIPVLARVIEQTAQLDKNIRFITITDNDEHLLTQWPAEDDNILNTNGELQPHTVSRDITFNNDTFGTLSISWHTNTVEEYAQEEALFNIVIDITKLCILAIVILLLIRMLVVKPIVHLSNQIEGFSKRLSYTPYSGSTSIEVSLLEQSMEELTQSLKTKAKLSEELLESENKLKTLISSSLDAIVLIDKQGIIREYNPAAEHIFGFSAEEAIGENLGNLIIPEALRDMHHKGMRRFNETGEAAVVGQRLELSSLHKDGYEFPVEVAIVPVTLSDETYFAGFLRDQTEQKAAESASQTARDQAERAAQAKSNFLTTMSHEIRTPLNAVVGILGLLEATKLNDEQAQLLHTGLDSGEHLSTIINDILDFSKLESGKSTIESNEFNLPQLMLETSDILRTLADKKSLPLKLNIGANVPEMVIGDHARFRQILINLVNNAIKFTHAGNVRINLNVVSENQHGVRIRCEVIDTGSGVPAHIKDRLFDEFFMEDQSYTRRHEGTGLGLAISKRMINLMGGDIGFESVPEQGSTFFFEIPMQKLATTDGKKSSDDASGQRIPNPGTRVLVAEDNQANQMIARKMLETVGLKVDIAVNGLEAVEAVRTLPYDVVLMDLSMPLLDGLDATENIRALESSAKLTPIIALTAHASEEDRQRCLIAGMNDYLQKPIDKTKTLDCIARWAVKKHEPIIQEEPEGNEPKTGDVAPYEDLIDKSVLQQLVDNTSLDVLPELVELYCDEVEQRISLINAALESKDISTIQFETHSIGSSAASYGNMQLHRTARAIEQQCKDNLNESALEKTLLLPDLAAESINALKNLVRDQFS